MLARALSLAMVGLAVVIVSAPTGGAAQDKKFEVPKDAVIGKVKSVDLKASNFTITLRNGKPRTFNVNDKTEFWGPKGGDRGTGPKGLKDDCMATGYDLKVMPTKDGKTAKDVYLAVRK